MKLALFDMDGTLSNDTARKPAYEAKDWPKYWDRDAMLSEPAWPEAEARVNALLDAGWQVGVLSARLDELNREVTETWLTSHGFYLTPVFLRDEQHRELRPPEFKLLVLEQANAFEIYDEVVLYDNDIEVVNLITEKMGPEFVVHATWESAEGEPA